MIKQYPGFFARALAICGTTDGKNLDALMQIPLVLAHAEDDKIVKPINYYALTGQEFLGSFALYDTLRKMGKQDIYLKKYPAGTMMKDYGINPHCSWYPALRNDIVKDWFFGNSLG